MVLEDRIESYKVASEFLMKGKIVVVPGLMNYSIVANALNSEAVKKVYEIKKRSFDKPITLVVPPHESLKYIKIPEKNLKALLLLGNSIVLIGKANEEVSISEFMNKSSIGLGITWPNTIQFKLLHGYSSFPITGTSLNESGEDPVRKFEDAVEKFDGKVDLIINGGECPHQGDVSVLDISEYPPILLRAGLVEEAIIRSFLPDLRVRN